MADMNLGNLAFELTDDAKKVTEFLMKELPDASTKMLATTPEMITALPDGTKEVCAALCRDGIGQAEYICRNGRAIAQLTGQLGKVDGKATVAVLAACAAIGGCYWLYKRYKNQEARIQALEQEVNG